MKNKQQRITAFIIGLIFVVFLLAASVFIAGNSQHDCIGDDCPICTSIELCYNIIHTFSCAVIGRIFVFAAMFIIVYKNNSKSKSLICINTLITLKVELLS